MWRGKALESREVGGTPVEVSAVAIEHLVGDLDVVLGMDVIEQLGGVMVRNDWVDFGWDDA